MSIILAISLVLVCIYLWKLTTEKTNTRGDEGKPIPVVSGAWPLIGHALQFFYQPHDPNQPNLIPGIRFFQKCYKTYGGIFRVKMFLRDMIIICDPHLKEAFFSGKEDYLSSFGVLKQIHFNECFCSKPTTFKVKMEILKSGLMRNTEKLNPIILEQANNAVSSILALNKTSKKFSLHEEMTKFVMKTSSKSFIGMDLTDQLLYNTIDLTHLVDTAVQMSYYVPPWLLKLILFYPLKRKRDLICKLLEPEISKYRSLFNNQVIDSQSRLYSPIIHKALEYRDDKDFVNGLTDRDIAEIIMTGLYASTENTSLLATTALIDLAQHPDLWNKIKTSLKHTLEVGDTNKLFSDPLLNACIFETARLIPQIISISRQPMLETTKIEDYDVSGVNMVSLCLPLMMVHGDIPKKIFSRQLADGTYDEKENTTVWNPFRFLRADCPSAPTSDLAITNWGAKYHLCPGKKFAINEVKAICALMTLYFEPFDLINNKIEINYNTSTSIAKKEADVYFVPSN